MTSDRAYVIQDTLRCSARKRILCRLQVYGGVALNYAVGGSIRKQCERLFQEILPSTRSAYGCPRWTPHGTINGTKKGGISILSNGRITSRLPRSLS
jgi:hypothetical protein